MCLLNGILFTGPYNAGVECEDMRQPRIGHINFINCLPLTYGFSSGGFANGLTVNEGVPSALNQKAIDGQLDITPVSSIIYAQHPDKFLLMPNLSISADGALQSILLVSRVPIAQLSGSKVALTAKSATSHGLLKIILNHAYQVNPDYFISRLSLDAGVLETAEAALFIGDDALYAYHHRVEGLYYYDIGQEWKKLTGSAMVYAVWVINRGFADEYPQQVQAAYRQLTDGFQYGLFHLHSAADTLIGKFPFDTAIIREYIGLLNYKMTDAHKQALLTYYTLAKDLGLIPSVPDLEFFEVTV